ncbi:hypothetical protein BU15DRAFT_65632 [Melanogaster broomeanus]|nr:hypothetical protein BU15DRAFT_65632 [Melanogaster broomeanus]
MFVDEKGLKDILLPSPIRRTFFRIHRERLEIQGPFEVLEKMQTKYCSALAHKLSLITPDTTDLPTGQRPSYFHRASLTYSAVFSSTRVFNCGFIVPAVALLRLGWASLRPKEAHFGVPHLWNSATQYLHFRVRWCCRCCDMSSQCVTFRSALLGWSGRSNHGCEVGVDIAPPPAASLALVCLAVAVVVTLVAGLFHYIANGWKLQIGDFVGNRRRQGHGFVDYVLA